MDFSEFTAGVERLVGSGYPNGSGKESLQQQNAAQPVVYLGDFHDDKRHGFGLYKVANGWGYLGGWSLGVPNGAGFELHLPKATTAQKDTAVPLLVSFVKMQRGGLVKRERFDDKNPAHARVLRRAGLSVDRAIKRAALARQLAVKCCNDGLDYYHEWALVESGETMCTSAQKLSLRNRDRFQ